MNHVSKRTALLVAGLEVACLIVIAIVFATCEKAFVGYSFKYDGSPYYRFYDIFISFLPVVFLYGLLRILLSTVASAVAASGLTAAIGYANHVKSSLTGEPLSWTDISGTANVSIIGHYVKLPLGLGVAAAGFLAIALFARFEWPLLLRRIRNNKKVYIALAGLLVLASTLRGRSAADAVAYAGNHFFEALGVNYDVFEWPKNVKRNGLGIHLIHTSLRHMPSKATSAEEVQFKSLGRRGTVRKDRPRTVVLILCESCWHDRNHFRDVFQPLVDRGFIPFRGISPVYGGGTVNSAFEMITGLPAHSDVLTGIIYQEYAPVISDEAHALPNYLAEEGYRTVAMHNNLGKFWNRTVVAPKMGFDEFHDIVDMGVKPTAEWVDDSVLFQAALREIDSNSGRPLFMHLTTVYTHGGYDRKGDLGESSYRGKLLKSISSLAKFVDELRTRDPDALVVIYGDHKPQLTSYFVREGVFSPSLFQKSGDLDTDFLFADEADRSVIGDVPLWIRGADRNKVERFVNSANAKPLFCISTLLDQVFLSSGLPAFTFGQPICRDFGKEGYEATVLKYPPWLFSESILK
jgi:hypothetical protein